MAKDRGIVIKFDKDLYGDVTGLNPPIIVEPYKLIDYSIDYPFVTGTGSNLKYAFDGSSSLGNWYPGSSGVKTCMIDFGEDKKKRISRMYLDSTSHYSKIVLEGSNDGVAFEEIYTSTDTIANYEGTFDIIEPNTKPKYSIFKISITLTSSSFNVREISLYEYTEVGNERAFTVTGKERQHEGGPLINCSYNVDSTDIWKPDETYGNNYIILKLNRFTRMRNPEGHIKVKYSKSLGKLQGDGGARVEDFEVEFISSDLVFLPNPLTEENIKSAVNLSLDLIRVEHGHFDAKEENIKVASTLSLEFTNITGVYP